MAETAVHVTTLEQWKSVLDVWFEQGYSWPAGDKEYSGHIFASGGRFLFLDDYITYSFSNSDSKPFIEFEEFMAQQKEVNKMETYYVTLEQLDLIKKLKSDSLPLFNLVCLTTDEMKELAHEITDELDSKILRYIGGDETIEFKVKETLYRLWRIDDENDRVYFYLDNETEPDWTVSSQNAFTTKLEEITKWKTPAWEIEEAH